MTRTVELSDVTRIIREHLGVDAAREITVDDRFVEDFSADSLDMVELLMAFEEEYAVELPEDDLAQEIETVQQAIDAIQERIDAGSPQAVS